MIGQTILPINKIIMRKVLFAVLVCAIAVVMASCGGHPSTPRGVAEKSLDCAIKKDFKGFYDCYYYSEDMKDQKKQEIEMTEEVYKMNTDNSQLPVSYKFVSEDVDEENGRAAITFEITYGSGREREETVRLKKEEDGKWYIRR